MNNKLSSYQGPFLALRFSPFFKVEHNYYLLQGELPNFVSYNLSLFYDFVAIWRDMIIFYLYKIVICEYILPLLDL